MKRTASALLLAAATVTLLWLGYLATLGSKVLLPNDSHLLQSFGKWYLAALAGIFVVGLPTHLFLSRLGWRQWWAYALSSTTLVGLPMWLLAGSPSPIEVWPFFLGVWLPCVFLATVGGLVFWFVGVRARYVQAPLQP
jgi:hypothetical protein